LAFVPPTEAPLRPSAARPPCCSLVFFLVQFLAVFLTAGVLSAQVADRVTQLVDPVASQPLANHHPLWAVAANDAGAVPADLKLNQLTLVLARSPQQEQAFEQFLADQQDPASLDFHQWLSADEVGRRFGLSDDDLAAVRSWLESEGLYVSWISPSRTFVGFSGTAADVGRAFRTELHYYNVNGEQRLSVASAPMIPQALSPVIKSVRGLYSIGDRPSHLASLVNSQSGAPQFSTGTSQYIAPADFATIYNVPANLNGSGVTIGIVGWAFVNFADLDNFRAKTGTSFPNPTEVVPTAFGGVNPGAAYTTAQSCSGCLGGQEEATLDVTRAGSVAPSASLLLVSSAQSGANDGIGAAAQYLIQTTPAPAQVISISFGDCESDAGFSGVTYWNNLFEQAAAEGISVFVSSGDSGAAGCETSFAAAPASPKAISPNYICASPYATCVGGTEFNDQSEMTEYWSAGNGADLSSVLGYIPEGGWNEPEISNSKFQVAASGGGVSSYIATPPWQASAAGVPAAHKGRYTPDVAFSASCREGYFGCLAAGGGSCVSNSSGAFSFVSYCGTSAGAPSMAGIAALLDQKLAGPAGNLNPELYAMQSSEPAALHDVTVATSGVTDCAVSTPSMCNNSVPAAASLTEGESGYLVGAGYDEVTGLGSLNVLTFINEFNLSGQNAPQVALKLSASSITQSQPLTVTVKLTAVSGQPAPSGSVVVSSGSYHSPAKELEDQSAAITIPAGSLDAGADTITATYIPGEGSISTYSSSQATSLVLVSAINAPGFSIAGTPITIVPGATSGNTSTILVTPVGGFNGSVTLTAQITSTPANLQLQPTLSFGSTSPVSITGAEPVAATLTIVTTAPVVAAAQAVVGRAGRWYPKGGAALAFLLFLCVPVRRRQLRNLLGAAVLLAALACGISGCDGQLRGSGATLSGASGTSSGSYIVTVTATAGSMVATTQIPVTVQ
jgi:Pro-kumamolisin, activation domain